MSKNKHILEVCLSPDLGGLELYMKDCTYELSSDFTVVSTIAQKGKLSQYFENSDLDFFELKRKSSFSLTAAWKLAKIIDKKSIDIIHLHWTKDIPIVVLAKLLSKQKPKIVQTRHMTMTRFKDDFYHKFLYKHIDLILAVTKQVKNQIIQFIPKDIAPKVQTLYLGAKSFDLLENNIIEEFKKEINPQNSFMVGLIGRINEFKGQHLLLDAIKILVDKGLDIQAFIVGHAMSEEYLETLKKKVVSSNLSKNFHFVGFTNEPEKFMQACDVVVMASKNETFGLVTIEAMKNGTAVVGSNSGGVLEIIDDEQTGLLFQSGDYRDLSKKIEKLYKDKLLKEKLAANGKEKADIRFDKTKQFEELAEVFKLL